MTYMENVGRVARSMGNVRRVARSMGNVGRVARAPVAAALLPAVTAGSWASEGEHGKDAVSDACASTRASEDAARRRPQPRCYQR
jgi:hypothetical protein